MLFAALLCRSQRFARHHRLAGERVGLVNSLSRSILPLPAASAGSAADAGAAATAPPRSLVGSRAASAPRCQRRRAGRGMECSPAAGRPAPGGRLASLRPAPHPPPPPLPAAAVRCGGISAERRGGSRGGRPGGCSTAASCSARGGRRRRRTRLRRHRRRRRRRGAARRHPGGAARRHRPAAGCGTAAIGRPARVAPAPPPHARRRSSATHGYLVTLQPCAVPLHYSSAIF